MEISDKDMKHLDSRLIVATNRLEGAKREYDRVCREVVLSCTHPKIAECREISPPWRVCRVCGLTEEGWGCGYKVLAGDSDEITSIHRYRMLNIRTVSLFQRDQGETLVERVDDWYSRFDPD